MQTIKTQQLQARKDRATVKASILTTLIGEAAMIGKNDGSRETSDLEVVAVIKKFVKNIDESIKAPSLDAASYVRLVAEREILVGFLPKQLNNADLLSTIYAIITEVNAKTPQDMGKVMKTLKAKHDGQFDGTIASALIKAALIPS